MRAFIFSIDAFVAFTLALLAVYSLIFFSSVPSGYYGTLAQAHTLAIDGLQSLSQTDCPIDTDFANKPCADSPSYLEYVVMRNGNDSIPRLLSPHIPKSFGYRLERKATGGNWEAPLYDSKVEVGRPTEARKLSVSAYSLVFESSEPKPSLINPYSYLTCHGEAQLCSVPTLLTRFGSANVYIVRLTVYT